MKYCFFLIILISNQLYGQSKFDSQLENSVINRKYLKTQFDYLRNPRKDDYNIIVVHTLKELSNLKNKEQIKAINFQLQYPGYDKETDIPEILNFKNLEYLDIFGNVNIPEGIDKLQKLKYLSTTLFSTKIQPKIGNLKNLESLRFEFCDYQEKIPEEIYNLTNLKVLVMNRLHFLDSISPSIGNLVNLEKLSFDDCVVKLPIEILKLTKLKYLVCPKAQSAIYKLKTLKVLHTVALDSTDLIGLGNLSNLEELYLVVDNTTNELKKLKNLKYLFITSHHDTKIIDLSSLLNLEVLIMIRCKIRVLPSFIYNLKKIKYITANVCEELNFISPKINSIKSLEYLELKGNKNLKEYPKIKNKIIINFGE